MVGITSLKGRGQLEIGLHVSDTRTGTKRQIEKAYSEINKQTIYGGKNPFLNTENEVRLRPRFLPKEQRPLSMFIPSRPREESYSPQD